VLPRKAPRTVLLALIGLLGYLGGAYAFQREFREFPGERAADLKPGDLDPAEFVFAHLMYPDGGGGGGFFRRGGFRGDWRSGNGNWTNDYPAADRHLAIAINRLTLINARGAEQPVNLEDGDDVFNWPFLYAVRTIGIDLTDEMTGSLRDYIDRGGFFIADDMWGAGEHQAIFALLAQLYPGRELVELGDDDTVMHMLFDLNDRYQILGQWGRYSMQPLNGASDPHWRGMFDEKDRMVLAVWLNNDTGDSWEWADNPTYPEAWSALGFRIVLNHIVYAMTH
jgi:hypothetical protein